MSEPASIAKAEPTRFAARLCGPALVLLTFAAYLPALGAGFIWDDDRYVTENATLTQPGGLAAIWTDPAATPQYYPLVHTTYWVEYRLWGLWAGGYHLTNVLLHALGALLLWSVARRVGFGAPWLLAAAFALHPVHAESVAWITERKNTLSGVFALASLALYLRYRPLNARGDEDAEGRSPRAGRFYWASLLCFAAALLSKTVTATLPGVILVLTWWKRGRIDKSDLRPLIPFIALGAVMGLTTVWLEKFRVGALGEEWNLSAIERALLACRALWFYPGKLLWPLNLSFIYPRWEIDGGAAAQYLFAVATIASFAALGIVAVKGIRGPSAAALIFTGVLFPALGFFDVYPFRYSYVADHFQYLASIAMLALGIGAVRALLRNKIPARRARPIALTLALVWLTALGTLTFRQCAIYRDRETLWLDTIEKTPGAAIAYNNLGLLYLERGDRELAVQTFEKGIVRSPGDLDLISNLGGTLIQAGRMEDAARVMIGAVDPNKADPWTLNNLGLVLAHSGKSEGAIDALTRAIELNPTLIEAYNNLATTLAAAGRRQEAVQILAQGLEIDPSHRVLRSNLQRLRSGGLRAPEAPPQ